MTETTEQAVKLDYSTWTYDDHLDMVERLAAQADGMASTTQARSVAAQHRESILQITARAQVHGTLAALKKPEPVMVAADDTVSSAKTQARRRQAGNGDA